MLYSLISEVAPSKYFSQTKLRKRPRLLVRVKVLEFRSRSTSARSASTLWTTDTKLVSGTSMLRGIARAVDHPNASAERQLELASKISPKNEIAEEF
jgi:hypothetical protein